MSRVRKITADHMTYSKRTSAHVTTVFHIDMTNVDNIRAKAKNGFMKAYDTKLTYMPFIFKAIAAALRKHRNVNASVDGDNIVYKRNINIGMAVAMDKGLLVPVIRDADTLNLAGLAKTANDLADRARSKKLGPDELKGGTFTVTNPGVFGSLFGTPIINQPQVAIMGIGTIEKRPKVITDDHGVDAIAIRKMCYFGITYDHRVVDGADADHFMNDVIAMLEGKHWPELDPFV
jgi:2-oxoglutarate dehydrogenase E2 component (dihydrolipoamide succinyltransferase)